MIGFLKFTWLYILISAVIIGSGLYSMARYGFTYSIDFIGGSIIEYQFDKKTDLRKINDIIKRNKIETAQTKFEKSNLSFKTKPLNEKQEVKLRSELETELKLKIKLQRFETVGPVIGRETMQKTLMAAFLATLGILLYMSIAFKGLNYALAAILAMIHDFLVVIGMYSLFSHFFGAEIDTMFVTAILTTMSFSVHDTIIIFDKIREYLKNEGRGDIAHFANRALTETMVRSLNNSMTIMFMLLSLTLLGGSTIRFFVATLLVGTVTGTYSSPFVATPILVWLEKGNKK
jgi:preprotein translocase subunit SecF